MWRRHVAAVACVCVFADRGGLCEVSVQLVLSREVCVCSWCSLMRCVRVRACVCALCVCVRARCDSNSLPSLLSQLTSPHISTLPTLPPPLRRRARLLVRTQTTPAACDRRANIKRARNSPQNVQCHPAAAALPRGVWYRVRVRQRRSWARCTPP